MIPNAKMLLLSIFPPALCGLLLLKTESSGLRAWFSVANIYKYIDLRQLFKENFRKIFLPNVIWTYRYKQRL